MDTHKPWYQSPAIQGIIAILVARVIAHFNLGSLIPPVMGVDLVNTGLEALTAAAGAWMLRELKNPPTAITMTKAAADVANAVSKSTTEGTSNAQPVQPSQPTQPSAAPTDGVSGTAAAPKP